MKKTKIVFRKNSKMSGYEYFIYGQEKLKQSKHIHLGLQFSESSTFSVTCQVFISKADLAVNSSLLMINRKKKING